MSSSSSAPTLHPEAVEYLRAVSERAQPIDFKTYHHSTAREASLMIAAAFGGDPKFDGTREEITVIHEAAVPVPCWVYRPSSASGKPNPCICIYFHGGGWTVGCRATHDVACKNLADRGACIVVSVEYRLAPEHKSPACYEDGMTLVLWALQNKTVLGGSDASLVGVAGDSAGGNIAASLCHTVPGIAFQVLVYPSVDLSCSFPSIKEFEEGYALTKPFVEWFVRQFLSSKDEQTDVVVSPLYRQSFTGLPPALFIIAMCDPLRDEGLAYAQKLESAGVHVQVFKMEGLIHGFFSRSGAFPKNCNEAYETVGQFLQKF